LVIHRDLTPRSFLMLILSVCGAPCGPPLIVGSIG
jgi:hypothetical protein